MRLLVIGNGMVGARFAEDVVARDRAGKYDVTVIGAEACETYNRVLLSEVVAGRQDLGSITLPSVEHPRLTVLRGVTAAALDREDRVVVTTDGSRHRYDQLVLATGASARIPPLDGLDAAGWLPLGVHALRSIDDAREIVAATLNARRAVVLGAGVLGVEAASGLAQRGCPVTIVHPADALMERQLDPTASSVLVRSMPGLGISPRVGVGAEAAIVAHGRLTGLRLTDGEVVESDLLVVATGTVANTSLAAAAGLPCGRGIVTDTTGTTADPRIFAIGDCAQPPEGGTGLVAQGWDQARRLAERLTGSARHGRAGSDGASDVVRVKAHGLDVVTMGVCGGLRPTDPEQRTLSLSDPGAGRHIEVVVAGGRLVGATCVGAGQVASDLVAAYTRRTPVPRDPAHLLLATLSGAAPTPAAAADLPDDAAVCRCNGVSKADVVEAHSRGARSVAEVARETRATTGCGGCRDEVCSLLDWLGSRDDARLTATTAAV